MAERKYSGGCQCGAVKYGADVDLSEVIDCNCSRCGPMGFRLSFTDPGSFDLLSGEDDRTEYLFASKTIRHRFCTTCGVESYAYGQMPDGKKMIAINGNCLDGVTPDAGNIKHYDGASV